MLIETRARPPFMKNGFVVACEVTREAVIVDPGDEVGELLDVVSREALRPRYILLTHAHVDHVTGVGAAKRALGVPIYLHEADLFLYQRADQVGRMFGLTVEVPPPVDAYYDGSAPLAFGRLEARAHHTPGHCPGGVCLAIAPAGEAAQDLFVGDTLFAGSIGRTDLPGGDHPTLIRSIREVLFPFGDGARVYPGHGPETTIGEERRNNPFLAG
jgi:glyoxylase-like metal-dependent hydrolase (beta-lactamase superfamily II)